MKHKKLSTTQKKKAKEQKHQKLIARAAEANVTPPEPPAPGPPPEEKQEEPKSWLKRWWRGLSPDGRTGTVVASVGVVVTLLGTFGWDIYKGDKAKESTQPSPTAPSAQEPHQQAPEPQKQVPAEQKPERPHLIYVPLHNAPHKKPNSFLAYFPKEGTEVQTVDIGGEKVQVMTQEDLKQVLAAKTPLEYSVKVSGRTDVFVSIGEDGKVQEVEGVSGNQTDTREATKAIEHMEFKPFVKDGKNVAVKTVIQLDPKISEKQEN